jgi:leucyl-tRNA synthetase
MRGRNVLYPMAFHVTGAPVIGISKRIAKGDEKTIRLYRDLYKVPEHVLATFSDPLAIVRHFSDEYERVMRMCGLSIDWRRRFTTVDPTYVAFIEWQWKHLHDAGYVVRGAHPVRYCPQCDNPVGDHDLLEGEKTEILKFTVVAFTWEGTVIPTATLRPETIYGVTNLWVNPDTTYVEIQLDGRSWLVSREAATKLALQDHTIMVGREVPGRSLVGQHAHHPLCGEVPILPASFVDPDMATGIVMSVPAHAPFDYIALRDLQEVGRYPGIKPVPLITVPGYGSVPAKEIVERAGVKDQNDPRMETLTQDLYSAEFAKGRLYDHYGGKTVREARDEVAALMVDQYRSLVMYEFDTRPVVCRCGSRVFVKILHDQWFLAYSDQSWKESVRDQLARMDLVPPEVRTEFERTVDWLKDWACTRRVGLGTHLPWDPTWLIEPLSDSTVYMAYYTIAHKIKDLPPEILTPEVFDFLFLGIETENLPERERIEEMRREFLYWYPYDFRFSAKDLISNHLTFQIFHHVAIFPQDLLPLGMVVFGMGLLNGAKMSSSKGNVILLEDAIEEFGADAVRMFLVGSAEPWQDFDWRNELVSSTRRQIERFSVAVRECGRAGGDAGYIDRWLLSRLQHHIARSTESLLKFQTRQALQGAFNAIEADLKWYRRRLTPGATGGDAVRALGSVWVRLLSPFVPFTCEELWREMGQDGLVSFAPWPQVNPVCIDYEVEIAEELLSRTIEDVESIRKILPLTPSTITLVVAQDWKWAVFSMIGNATGGEDPMKDIMRNGELRMRGKETVEAVRQCRNLIHRLPPHITEFILKNRPDELGIFSRSAGFLTQEFGIPVMVVRASDGSLGKAASALPYKPAIIIE